MNTPKPIELISMQAAYTLRMCFVTRQGWIKKLYASEPLVVEAELANLAECASELGIEL